MYIAGAQLGAWLVVVMQFIIAGAGRYIPAPHKGLERLLERE